MEKIIKIDGDTIKCEHRQFLFEPQYDKVVLEKPEEATLYHECGELTIWQQRRGIGRYFLKNGEINKPESPEESDTFLAGLMGAEEPDQSQELNEKGLEQSDGADTIPF